MGALESHASADEAPGGERLARPVMDRVVNLGFAWMALSPIGLARILEPSSEGVGTHQQLGLPPCTFLYLTSLPCPFCGMTTSWTHAAHLDLDAAIYTQPAGVVLFLLTLALGVALLGRAVVGAAPFRPDRFAAAIPAKLWWGLASGLMLGWGWKIFVMTFHA